MSRTAQADAAGMMRVGPSEAAYRSSFQTAFKLLRLTAVVVSIKGKGTFKCQVRNRKTNESEPLMRRRKDKMMSKPMSSIIVGTSRKGTCALFLRHPAYRRREFITGMDTERENLSLRWQEKTSSCGHSKAERIEAQHGGGTSRSSGEAAVMGAERRGSIVWFCSKMETEDDFRRY